MVCFKMIFKCGGYSGLKLGEDLFNESAYILMCAGDPVGFIISILTFIIQFFVLAQFMSKSSESHPQTLFVTYVPECNDNGQVQCVDSYTVTQVGAAIGFLMIFLYSAPTLAGGIHLVCRRAHWTQVLMGIGAVLVGVYGVVAATVFNGAASQNDVDVLLNCVAVLFILDLDEGIFNFVKLVFPGYVEAVLACVKNESKTGCPVNPEDEQTDSKTDGSTSTHEVKLHRPAAAAA